MLYLGCGRPYAAPCPREIHYLAASANWGLARSEIGGNLYMAQVILKQLTKSFKSVTAVNSVDLEIKDKEFMVFVGPSGCGKTTCLRMIAGLEEATSGEIYIGDRLVNDVSPKDRDIAMVFQNYALYPHMSVYDNMAFGLKLRKVPKDQIKSRVAEAAQLLGLADLLNRKPKQLSGGQRQRVALGRAIVREPAVFLMDEPLSNLDAKLRVQTRAELIKLHRRLGITTIYVTHDQVEAMTMGDRIMVMCGGLVQQVDTPLGLYNKPANKFVAGFIGTPSMNFLNVKIEDGGIIDGGCFKVKAPADKIDLLKPYVGKEVEFGVDRTGWGEPREFRNLHWEGGVYHTDPAAPAAPGDVAPKNLDEVIQKEIKKSIELEKREKH